MRNLTIFLYEGKHFIQGPFKILALVLFMGAAIYGLHNGAALFHQHQGEIVKIYQQDEEDRETYLNYYREGKRGPENRPWVDMTEPFWGMWSAGASHVKAPSPAMVYSTGQAEQFGFYKRITFLSSPYDADLTEEIANPERLQSGTLDFTFAIVFLMPLLLLVWVYNLKGAEKDQGFFPLIEVQTAASNNWLLTRLVFYGALLFGVSVLLILYGNLLTNAGPAVGAMILYTGLYILLWCALFGVVLLGGSSVMGN
ncbi:MAG: hypothetical protein AAFV07_09010, partial [Bacteroidota bacterium]